jgi:hypothetical protein
LGGGRHVTSASTAENRPPLASPGDSSRTEAPVASPISEVVLNAVAIEITETSFTEAIATSSADADTGIIDGEPLTETGKQRRARKTRPTLPAWDNIV